MNAHFDIIRVVISEHDETSVPDGGSIPTTRLAEFTFDPSVNRTVDPVTLHLRDMPPILISLGYAAHTGGISLFIQHLGRDLVDLGNFAPTTNSYLGIRLSEKVSLSVHFNREPR